ncbi:WXG100 family type VII secretion target [Demequina subtropica]|uniref:WXG100 family type VII secretion target n=1 Tax=Demequina subtropica TaxID=1638989 RepID=UPI00078507B5|nr:WXG100 family type VII secretion target [Demequina subtropica]
MADIKVTSESLSSVANQLSGGATQIESHLAQLKSMVSGLVAGDWSGAASQSFMDLYEQWDTAGIQLKESLSGIADQLAKTALAYEESEGNIANSFRG